jgi:ribosomal protein L17
MEHYLKQIHGKPHQEQYSDRNCGYTYRLITGNIRSDDGAGRGLLEL